MKKTPVLGFAFVAILLLLGCSSDEISAQNESRVENISKSDKTLAKLLKIFREEFLKITPGRNNFPKSVAVTDANSKKTWNAELTFDFQVNKFEVTQDLWKAVTGSNPSRWKGPRNSVEMLTFSDAVKFCKTVTDLLKKEKLIDADQYVRLPTEIEWEYVARAGTTTKYSFGDSVDQLDDYAWHTGNAAGNDPPVGAKKANAWGLYDVHGYLWEWCIDSYGSDSPVVQLPDSQWPHVGKAVLKSGSWKDKANKLESRFRQSVDAKAKDDAVGFRCVLVTKQEVEPKGKTKKTAKRNISKTSTRPNIVLIMADDLGWMDLNCQGNDQLITPNLNRLAEQGMRFTDAYAAAPVCSPTRAALMTGLAPARLHITNHLPDQKRFVPDDAKLNPAPCKDFLDDDYTTLAEYLKTAGYANAFLGKWHLSDRGGKQGAGSPKYYPENQGFDINVGGCSYGGPPTFFDPYKIHNLPPRKQGEYLPDRLADESIKFIDANKDGPFFLCLWNYTVHWPMEAPETYLKKYEGKEGPGIKDTRYAAMIEAYDASIGRIMNHLDEQNLSDDTLFIFTSDNGAYGGVSDLRPLREAKGYLYEGGIRVPTIIRYPGKIAAGTESATPIITMDYFATILDACGINFDRSQCDGESLLPLFENKKLQRESLYFHYPNFAFHKKNRLGSAIRTGDFKLINYFADDSVELYNLKNDIGEKKNLASEKPELASKMKSTLKQWLTKTNANLPTAR